MRDYAKVSPQFWIGQTGRVIKSLGIESQLLALYLMTCPHATMLGVYYLPIALIAHETGIPFEEASKSLQSLCEVGFCTYDQTMEYVWVHEMASYQIGDALKPNDNRIKAIQENYDALPTLSFLSMFFEKYHAVFFLHQTHNCESPLEGSSKPLRSQEQDQEQKQEKEQEQDISAAQTCALPVVENNPVILLPLKNGSEFEITAKQIEEWQLLYPNVDVVQTLRNIRGWNLANANRRKTRNGILKHITGWLTKEQNRVTQAVTKNLSSQNLFEHNKSIAQEWLEQNELK